MDSSEPTTEVLARRILLFRTGGKLYGCEIDAVREIVPVRPATRLPGAPAWVCGLVNLRGTIVTVLDLARRLDDDAPPRSEGSVVIVEQGGRAAGIAVDEVLDVQPLPEARIERAVGEHAHGGLVPGIGHLEDGTVVILLDMPTLVKQVLL